MPKIQNLTRLLRKLEKLERTSKRENNGVVVVGFAANYAVYVHENTEARHNANQQAKFLEQPAREESDEMGNIVVRAVKGGVTLIQGLILAGLHLQRAAQKLVPVDTGNLKGSAFTERE